MTTRYREIMNYIFAQPEDFIRSHEGRLLLAEALPLAPPEIKALMDAKLRELGMLPEATMCDDGNAVFAIDEMAGAFGVTVDEVREWCEELREKRPDSFHTGAVHYIH